MAVPTTLDAPYESRPGWRDVPGWRYTIGLLATHGHPDIVGPVFWDLAQAITAGRTLEPGRVYDDLLPSFEGQSCAFEPVAPEWLPELFGSAFLFYRHEPFPVLQYLWPDRNGRFAWDLDSTEELRQARRDLRTPPPEPGAPPPKREPWSG